MQEGPGQLLDSIRELRLLCEIADSGQLTKASEKFGLSPSAASRRIAQLKTLFHDELFIRTGVGLTPTPKMMNIRLQLQPILAAIDMVGKETVFNPVSATGEFRILTYDNGFVLFIAPLLRQISRLAPKLNVVVNFVPESDAVVELLRSGDADLVIFPIPPKRNDVHSVMLRTTDYSILVRKNHPLVNVEQKKGRIDLEDLGDYPQIVPGNRRRTPSQMRPWFKIMEAGQQTFVVPYFTASPFLLLNSDCFEWIPREMAIKLARFNCFSIIKPPKTADFTLTPYLIWAQRKHSDPLNQWIRSIILDENSNNGASS